MADYVASSSAYVASGNSIKPSLPSGWSPGHVCLALGQLYGANITWATPDGWTKVANRTQLSGDWAMFVKALASGESAPVFGASGSASLSISLHALSGLDTAAIVDSYSNTAYTIWDTSLVAASVTVIAQPVLLCLVGAAYDEGGAQAAAPPDGFTERYDAEVGASGLLHYLATKKVTANGGTGSVTATLAVETNFKHAFGVALKVAAALWVPGSLDGGLYDRMQGGL